MSNKLDELFVDGREIDKELVAEVLSPYIKIDKNTCEIRPLNVWNDQKAYIKILIYLLARKAMIAWELNITEEAASTAEIISQTGLRQGTVYPTVRRLFSDKILEQTKDKKYYVPNHAMGMIKTMISEGQGG